jgi:sterol desaturase/sphingolipid hydroxylase (fatty acid hydroxylase superfamily)
VVARNLLGHVLELMPAGLARSLSLGWLTTATHDDPHHAILRWNYGLYFTLRDRLMGTEHPTSSSVSTLRRARRQSPVAWNGRAD